MNATEHECATAGIGSRAGVSMPPLLPGEVHAVVGAAFEVLNALGIGFPEKVYENAPVVEFRRRGIPWEPQCRFPILHQGETVGEFLPDLVTHGRRIVETKVVDHLGDHERGQLLDYLRAARLRVGLLLSFRGPRL